MKAKSGRKVNTQFASTRKGGGPSNSANFRDLLCADSRGLESPGKPTALHSPILTKDWVIRVLQKKERAPLRPKRRGKGRHTETEDRRKQSGRILLLVNSGKRLRSKCSCFSNAFKRQSRRTEARAPTEVDVRPIATHVGIAFSYRKLNTTIRGRSTPAHLEESAYGNAG